jgi:hypothetical protein
MPAVANLRLYCDRARYYLARGDRGHPPAAAGPPQPSRLLLRCLQPALLLCCRLSHAPHLLQQLTVVCAGLLQRPLKHVQLGGLLGAVLRWRSLLPLCCLEGHLKLVPVAEQWCAKSARLCRWLKGSWPCADRLSGPAAVHVPEQEQVVAMLVDVGPLLCIALIDAVLVMVWSAHVQMC